MDVSANKISQATIGELLTTAGFITPFKLEQALKVAKSACCPVGRIMVMTGDLPEQEIQSVLQAQRLLRQGAITKDYAIRILRVAHRCNIPFTEALEKQGWKGHGLNSVNEMTELLVLSDLLSAEQLKQAVTQSAQTGMPLGRVLILTGTLPPSVMASVFSAQVLLRQNSISTEEAAQGLKLSVAKQISLEHALLLEGTYCPSTDNNVRLGELLGIAGLLSENDTIHAVEESLSKGKKLGSVLLDNGRVSVPILQAALDVQNRVSKGELTASQAALVLRYSKQFSINATFAIEHIRKAGEQVIALLKAADLVSDADCARGEALATPNALDPAQSLHDAGVIDEQLLSAARGCYRLIWKQVIRSDQAIIVLHYCHRTRVSVEEALEELAWDLPISCEAKASITRTSSAPRASGVAIGARVQSAPSPTNIQCIA